jgi:thiol:disulfide interchange protein DsbD
MVTVKMNRMWMRLWILLMATLAVLNAQAAHTRVELLLSHDSIRPGQAVTAGLLLKMDNGWHTYWQNPGASGIPTSIKWTLPPGLKAGEIRWPLPEKLLEEDLTTYIHGGEAMLLVPITVEASAAEGEIILKAEVSWLECEVACLPGSDTVSANLKISHEDIPSISNQKINTGLQNVPGSGTSLSATVRWDGPITKDTRTLRLEWKVTGPITDADFFPSADESFEITGPTERLNAPNGTVQLRKTLKKFAGDWPKTISGVAVQINGKDRVGHELSLQIGTPSSASPSGPDNAPSPGTSQFGQPLWRMLLYAFLGGLILNIMPCVLPVIALKILGFVSQAREDTGRIRAHGMVYALGVLVSFLTMAGIVIAIKAAGHRAGWGMQFGNPQFLVILTIIVTLVALNLFGLFEITPGAKIMDAAGSLASKNGMAGSFFNGVLATVLATPCTAPFLGAALGFAFAKGSGIILLTFGAAGAGLSFPYLLLSWNPSWLKWLPKPGAWMEHFKIAMGFPMLATAIWTLSLSQTHYEDKSVWLGIFLVILSLAAWVYGQFVQRSGGGSRLGWAATFAILLGGYFYVLENQMEWRNTSPVAAHSGSGRSKGPIPWELWSPEAVARARAEQRPILVDFTADWCLTCQSNKKLAIDVASVVARIKSMNVLPLLGDYTRTPPLIGDELSRFGRAGVPLVLVYPKNPALPPIVLPEILTPSILLDALERAYQ